MKGKKEERKGKQKKRKAKNQYLSEFLYTCWDSCRENALQDKELAFFSSIERCWKKKMWLFFQVEQIDIQCVSLSLIPQPSLLSFFLERYIIRELCKRNNTSQASTCLSISGY